MTYRKQRQNKEKKKKMAKKQRWQKNKDELK